MTSSWLTGGPRLLPALMAVVFSVRAARAVSDGTDADAIAIGYRLQASYSTFFMQAGFMALEAGRVRSKNLANIMLKNTADLAVCTLAFFVCGFAFAFGEEQLGLGASGEPGGGNGFIGTQYFLLVNLPDELLSLFFLHAAYAATAATIVSGAMAERTLFSSYMLSSGILAAWTYPVAVHWIWSPGGWLANLGVTGAIDVAGGSVVHCIGGIAGLVGTVFLGPRAHRFDEAGRPREMHQHSLPLQVLGTLILIYGWFSFNTVSVGALSKDTAPLLAKTAVVTLLSTSAGGMAMLAIGRVQTGRYTVTHSVEGMLAGVVAITPCCAVVEPWSALLIGAGAAPVVSAATVLLIRLRIDDPLNSVPIHLGAGIYGMICVGLFATKRDVCAFLGRADDGQPGDEPCEGGAIDGHFGLLGANVLATLTICVWAMVQSSVVFYVLRKRNALRIDLNIELEGLDFSQHG
jgi:Amt family ammonium transporter